MKIRFVRAVIFLLSFLLLLSVPMVAISEKIHSEEIKNLMRPLLQLAASNNLEKIINPDMESRKEVKDLLNQCQEINTSLDKIKSVSSLPDELEMINACSKLFLLFSKGVQLVNFQTFNNKALVKLREKVKLKPPSGFAFVRFYQPGLLSPELALFFPKEETAGVTILCRFVAIRMESKTNKNLVAWQRRLEKVLSHELVHAYINSILGAKHFNDLPKWFDEGCAVYFAENNPVDIVSVSPIKFEPGKVYQTIQERVMPEDYRNYLRAFNYLSKVSGKENFYSFIRETVTDHSVENSLPKLAKVYSYEELLRTIKDWETIRAWRIAVIFIVIILFLYTLNVWYTERGEYSIWISAKTFFLLLMIVAFLYIWKKQSFLEAFLNR